MLLRITFLLSFLIASLAGANGQQRSLRITAPQDKSDAPERLVVEGIAPDRGAKVWVIVHPMQVADYWVQQPVTVNEDGTWEVEIYIGRPGDVDVNKRFELLAVANPHGPLRNGDVLRGWPTAQMKSQVIKITRR